MAHYSFELTEHDAERPWIVVRQERRAVTLDERVNFFAWAQGAWPDGRYSVQLDPWQLSSSKGSPD